MPRFLIAQSELEQAEFYCKHVDENDGAYVALSLHLGYPLITRDKPLFMGLRKKGLRNVTTFDEFVRTI